MLTERAQASSTTSHKHQRSTRLYSGENHDNPNKTRVLQELRENQFNRFLIQTVASTPPHFKINSLRELRHSHMHGTSMPEEIVPTLSSEREPNLARPNLFPSLTTKHLHIYKAQKPAYRYHFTRPRAHHFLQQQIRCAKTRYSGCQPRQHCKTR